MSESTESKQTKKRVTAAAFVPQTMGIFVLLIITLSFIAGFIRGELVLTLVGAVFLAVWAYCLVMTLFLALINHRRARRIAIRLSPVKVPVGEQVALIYAEENRGRIAAFQLPGILIRCRLLLDTKDGRHIKHDFNPRLNRKSVNAPIDIQPPEFAARWRGAYFSTYDEFAIFDALGFFRFAFRLPQKNSVRLLVSPHAAEEPVPARARAGESNSRPELTFQRTDNLIDHRPYVPGDDPRRINWKLYGHGGELFVREGEHEPPPHSNILIIIDTQFDPLLYSAEMARNGVDLLCENALSAALACTESGQDVQIASACQNGNTGAVFFRGNTPAELSAALAWPAALPWSLAAELPAAQEDRGVLIFALPRANAESSALDRFLKDCSNRSAGRNKARTVELIFLYGEGDNGGSVHISELASAAETCAVMYNRRPGVRARAIGV